MDIVDPSDSIQTINSSDPQQQGSKSSEMFADLSKELELLKATTSSHQKRSEDTGKSEVSKKQEGNKDTNKSEKEAEAEEQPVEEESSVANLISDRGENETSEGS